MMYRPRMAEKQQTFAVGDRVTWLQTSGRKVGTVAEVVPAGSRPKNYGYIGSRDHEWYVIDVDGTPMYPFASKLRRTSEVMQ